MIALMVMTLIIDTMHEVTEVYMVTSPRIKSEMDDFRDNLSDLGRDDDLRWVIVILMIITISRIVRHVK